MAIIKCPECGRQISDKAPTCPSCGVEIAGKITKCPNCGEIYFSNLEMCPNCHELNPFAHKNDASGRNEPAGSCKPGSYDSAARSWKRSQTECNQTRRNPPSGGSQTGRSSGSRLVLRHLSEQQHLLPHPFLRFAHSNPIPRTAETEREPRKRKRATVALSSSL